jgi:hypothetical protein
MASAKTKPEQVVLLTAKHFAVLTTEIAVLRLLF